jgi:F-type H+-transporting ATPase subunit gamma
MGNMREIRSRIRSVRETKQITKAMKLISAAKLRKARNQLAQAFPYFEKVRKTMADILAHSDMPEDRYFAAADPDGAKASAAPVRRAYVVVTGDKGMAGAYNHNIIKLATRLSAADPDARLYVVGQVGRHHFLKAGAPVEEAFDFSVQNPTVYLAREVAEALLEDFRKGRIDEVHVVYTYMRSALRLEPSVMKLLPLDPAAFAREPDAAPPGGTIRYVEYSRLLYQPSPGAVLDSLIPKYVKGILYGAFVESFTSENSARMTAMDNATSNADKMLEKLRMFYNRTRQSAITQEISEIIGGASGIGG